MALFLLSERIVLERFALLEQSDVEQNTQRVLNSLANDVAVLNTLIIDWAHYNPTYQYGLGENDTFISDNFGPDASVFLNLGINLAVIINRDGTALYAEYVDPASGNFVTFPDELLAYITALQPRFLDDVDPRTTISGFIQIEDSLLMLASARILTSEREGPASGTLTFGRVIDADNIAAISDLLQLSLTIVPFQTETFTEDIRAAQALMSDATPIATIVLSDARIAGYAALTGIDDQAVGIVKIEIEREVYAQAQRTVALLAQVLFITGLFLTVLTLLLLERLVIRRVASLSAEVGSIRVDRVATQRVKVSANDEISALGNDINRMLDRLGQVQQELVASEAELRSLLTSTPNIISKVDPEGRMQFLHVPGVDQTALQPFIGQSFLSFVTDEQKRATRQTIQQVFAERRPISYEAIGIDPSTGDQRWYLTTIAPIVEGREVRAALVANTDISERMEAERALRHRDAVLEAVSVSSEMLLKTVDWREPIHDILAHLGTAVGASRIYIFEKQPPAPDGNLYVDQRYEWVAEGVTPEIDNPDLQNVSMADVLPRWQERFSQGQIINGFVSDFPEGERAILEPQGIISILVVPIIVEGDWWGFIGFDECSGERVWSIAEIELLRSAANNLGSAIQGQIKEAEIRDTSARLSALLQSMKAGILVEDEAQRIILTNQAFCNQFSIPSLPAGLVGVYAPALNMAWAQFVNPDHLKADTAQLLRDRTPVFDEECHLADGRVFLRDYIPLFVDGVYRGHLWQYHDVTDRKQAEGRIQSQNEALVRANRELAVARRQAEAASKLKSQFLATMSHELRTPLNAVIGYAQLQLAGMAGDLTEEQVGFQERILVNAMHLLQLINEVLDLSKIEAGRMELAERPIDLRACLGEVITQNQVLAQNKSLRLTLTVDERLPETILGDQGRIKQIIINLVSNAIKFTDAGSVTVDAVPHGDDSWRLTVTDTGVGIPSHELETIFDEFRQAEKGIEQGGTGLGLAIVRKLVLMMGGNIRVSSEVGRGSSFVVTLPLVTERQDSPELVEALTEE